MVATRNRVGRNEKCLCGSGKKYKRCCLAKNQGSQFGAVGALDSRRPLPIPNRQRSESGWLELHFTAPMKDGTQLYLVLLYSEKWVNEHKIDLGTVLEIYLPEIEFYGPITLGMIKDAEGPGSIEGHLQLVLHLKGGNHPGEVWVGSWKPAAEAEEKERQNHRKIILRMDHPDGSHIEMWLRRSLQWIAEHKAEVGGKVFLDLPEQGARGWADVIDIIPITGSNRPKSGRNRGKFVTGFFCHSAGWVGDLKVASESEPIGVTPGHLFWSIDRNDWVSVGDLKVGERLKTLNGITYVESYEMRPEPEQVYNIEVEDDHVFRVGETGILVHNSSARVCPDQTTYTLNPTETVTFQGREEQRATKVTATIVKDSPKGQVFSQSFPSWWHAFTRHEKNTGYQMHWNKGHLLDQNFGGPGRSEAGNMAPMIGTVNKSLFNKCQARIKAALECGCVFFEIKVEYVEDEDNQLRPARFIISADNNHGFKLNVTIENKTNAPAVCDKT